MDTMYGIFAAIGGFTDWHYFSASQSHHIFFSFVKTLISSLLLAKPTLTWLNKQTKSILNYCAQELLYICLCTSLQRSVTNNYYTTVDVGDSLNLSGRRSIMYCCCSWTLRQMCLLVRWRTRILGHIIGTVFFICCASDGSSTATLKQWCFVWPLFISSENWMRCLWSFINCWETV